MISTEVACKYVKFSKQDKDTLNYLAGYFEGEGSIHLINQICRSSKSRKTLVLCATVGNTESDIVLIYKKLFGGSICKYDRGLGKPIFNWRLNSQKALNFCIIIYPYLRTKRKKELCKLAIKFQSHKRVGGGKFSVQYRNFENKIYKKIKNLNRRGRIRR